MARGISRIKLFDFTATQRASSRAAKYEEDAARFRQLAQIETNETLRENLVDLARRYEESLASIIAPKRRD